MTGNYVHRNTNGDNTMSKRVDIAPLKLPLANGVYETNLYQPVTDGFPSDFEDTIVLAPGWLGSGTLHFAASSLARRGHTVAVVGHRNTSLLHPNLDRSRHVHFTAKAAAHETGRRGIILVGHSNGNQDIHHAAVEALKRQESSPDDESLYIVQAIGSLAGVGLSGQPIHAYDFHKEVKGFAKELAQHPAAEMDVVSRSIGNLLRHPIHAAVEGVSATFCDVRPHASRVINVAGLRSYEEVYFEQDGIIPKPSNRGGFEIIPGSHITPIVDQEILSSIVERLYENNSPSRLELATHTHAA